VRIDSAASAGGETWRSDGLELHQPPDDQGTQGPDDVVSAQQVGFEGSEQDVAVDPLVGDGLQDFLLLGGQRCGAERFGGRCGGVWGSGARAGGVDSSRCEPGSRSRRWWIVAGRGCRRVCGSFIVGGAPGGFLWSGGLGSRLGEACSGGASRDAPGAAVSGWVGWRRGTGLLG